MCTQAKRVSHPFVLKIAAAVRFPDCCAGGLTPSWRVLMRPLLIRLMMCSTVCGTWFVDLVLDDVNSDYWGLRSCIIQHVGFIQWIYSIWIFEALTSQNLSYSNTIWAILMAISIYFKSIVTFKPCFSVYRHCCDAFAMQFECVWDFIFLEICC